MSNERLFRGTRFTFIGEAVEGKNLITDNACGNKGWKKKTLNIGVKNSNNGSTQFLNIENMYLPGQTEIMMYLDGKQTNVNVDETSSPETLKKIKFPMVVDLETNFENKSEYTKLLFKRKADMEKLAEAKEDKLIEELNKKIEDYTNKINEIMLNRKEFGHIKDMLDFVKDAFPIIKGKKIKVTGSVRNNEYNGKNRWKYVPSSIEFVPEDTEDKLEVMCDVFYTNDSLDDDIKNKKFYINGWVGEKVKGKETLFPQTFVIDYTKIDENNETHKQLLEFLKDTFTLVDSKMVNKVGVELSVVSGAEKEEFNESHLTEKQRMQIAFKLKTLEDFKPKGGVFGDWKQELRVVTGDYKEYPDGAVKTDIAKGALVDYLQSDTSDVKTDDSSLKNNNNNNEDNTQNPMDLMKNLFG